MKRRDLIKYLSVAPLAGAIVGSGVPFQSIASSSAAAKVKRDLIKELGLRPFINAAGTFTTHTASLMHEDVVAAISHVSEHFLMINDVQDKVGEKIAAICHAEAAMVTAGCWSAIALGAAAALTGTDRRKMALLPDVSTLPKNEVILQRGHNQTYAHAIKITGAKLILIETVDELEKAVSEKTAMMWFLNTASPQGKIQHEEWIALGKKHKVPTMIDIAADVPPVENIWKFNDMGFDMVCLSGGKAIRGPQSAGVLMGKKDLIAAARLNAPPANDVIGRGMKVNKEEVIGMYAALDRYVNIDHDKEWKMWEANVALIGNAAKNVKGVSYEVTVPPISNHTPTLRISWDPALVKIKNSEVMANLAKGTPSIEVRTGGTGINITVYMLKPGEEKIVAKRVQEELSAAAVAG